MYIEFNDKEITERIKLRIKDLKNTSTIRSQADIARKMGFSAQQFSEILAGRNKLTPIFIIKFCVNTNTNYDYIVKGTYPIFDDEKNILLEQIILKEHQNTKDKEEDETKKDTRPRVPYTASAGSLTSAVEGVMAEQCEQIPRIVAFPDYDFTIIIKGNSMEPKYEGGDEVACKRVDSTSFIQWGKVHVMDTSQGIVIKRVYEDGDKIRCVSYNPEYPDFSISKDEIYSMSLVVGLLRM